MKRAALLHGTDVNPDELWFPWLKSQLEERGYSVYAPVLPSNHTPNRHVYNDFLRNSGWDFEDNIIIGHSSGATTLLSLLLEEWFPKTKAAVLVGTFLNERLLKKASPDWYDPSQFTDLFADSYDPERIKNKAKKFVFVHSDDDPYCDIADAQTLCNEVHGTLITIPGGGHLALSSGVTELPQIVNQLEADNLL
ncbi:MAG: hypothetical protein KatS3mg087_1860 [Patescibacteria group bacterium]|nr:MAG: hypothetical protein KatS3mg087_1860 [Patescibacteria group bacterium]